MAVRIRLGLSRKINLINLSLDMKSVVLRNKVVLLGDAACGKTCLLKSFQDKGEFSKTYQMVLKQYKTYMDHLHHLVDS